MRVWDVKSECKKEEDWRFENEPQDLTDGEQRGSECVNEWRERDRERTNETGRTRDGKGCAAAGGRSGGKSAAKQKSKSEVLSGQTTR